MTIGVLIFLYIAYKILFDLSWIKELKELPLPVIGVVGSLIFFMPCWFMILYYFFNNIVHMELWYVLAFCFVPTLIWYLLEWGSAVAALKIMNVKMGTDISTSSSGFWLAVFIDSLVYLTIFTLIAYYGKFTFEKFAWIAFFFRVFFFVVLGIGALVVTPDTN